MRLAPLALLCVKWCDDAHFRDWLKLQFKNYVNVDIDTTEGAAKFIRYYLGIRSRRELGTNGDAIARFNEEIRWPYTRYLETSAAQAAQQEKAAPALCR